jgi:hypothetical protein
LNNVIPEGPEETVGSHTESTFSAAQQADFGVDKKGNILDQAKFDAKIAAMKRPAEAYVPPVVEIVDGGGLPPWWILHNVTPEGPEVDHGSYKGISFSPGQQEEFGVDSEGKILDQGKFDAKIAALSSLAEPLLKKPRLELEVLEPISMKVEPLCGAPSTWTVTVTGKSAGIVLVQIVKEFRGDFDNSAIFKFIVGGAADKDFHRKEGNVYMKDGENLLTGEKALEGCPKGSDEEPLKFDGVISLGVGEKHVFERRMNASVGDSFKILPVFGFPDMSCIEIN